MGQLVRQAADRPLADIDEQLFEQCRQLRKAKLEGLFVDELARLQPSSGYMRS